MRAASARGDADALVGDAGAGEAHAGDPPGDRAAGARTGSRRWAWGGLLLVLAGGLGLRLWGIEQGLPYAYNADEADHFVPHAIAMFGQHLNPHYFANPPAYTYLLHYLFALAYGGAAGVQHAIAAHPAEVFTLARVAAAVLGVLALWLLYATGARLFGRGVGLLAAAIQAVAFLPVFYAHLALGDVPTLAPLTLSLLGTAGVLRKGRARDHLLAGVGLGLACATKYTAGIVLVPYLAAVAARYLDVAARLGSPRAARGAVGGIALAGTVALVAFLLANPYAILDYSDFHSELVHQSTLSAEAQGKLGAPRDGGLAYYLWTLTWGLGWAPALAALAGAVSVWWRERALGWLLVPAPALYLVFMGTQGRYFGRWLLPIFPILCLLAALFACQLVDTVVRLASRSRRVGPPFDPDDAAGTGAGRAPAPRAGGRSPLRIGLTALLVAVLLAQGLVYSVHAGKVLARADTRNLTREWMLAHIPVGAPIVVEPVAPDAWGERWRKYPSLWSQISSTGALEPGFTHEVGIEDYERTLAPALIGYYEAHGYCWVVSGSTESGRALADPREVPLAIAYYRALSRRGEVVYRASPYARGQGPVAFDFDWSFDYYPLAYHRPGPDITIYRLQGAGAAAERGYPECTDEHLHRHRFRAPGARDRAGAQRRGHGPAQPGRGRGGGARRAGARRGLARTVWRGARRGQRDRGVRPGRPERRDAVRVAGAVLPRGQDAAVHRGDRAVRDQARGGRLGRSDREGLGAGFGDTARRGRGGGARRRRAGNERAALEPGLSQARARRAPVGSVQVRDDPRRQGRDPHRATRSGSAGRTAASWRTAGARRSTRSSWESAPRWQTTPA